MKPVKVSIRNKKCAQNFKNTELLMHVTVCSINLLNSHIAICFNMVLIGSKYEHGSPIQNINFEIDYVKK